MEIFDSHTHLNDAPFRGKEDVYLERAKELGVGYRRMNYGRKNGK